MKGRKPKPTTLKIAAGTYREDRHGDGGPQPPPNFPSPPSGISASAKKVWEVVRERCESLAYITVVDGDLLLAYCNAVVQLNKAMRRGDDIAMRNWSDRVVKYGAEFGFSPSSRTRCRSVKKETAQGGKVGFTKTG